MKNQIVYILPGIFLLINAWYDIRKRKILLHSIWIFTVLWILFLMFVDKEKIWHLVEYFRECFCLPVLMRQGRPLAMEMDWQFVCAVCILEWDRPLRCCFMHCCSVPWFQLLCWCVKRGLTRQACHLCRI
mgnify:CR=1 FL=1